MRRQLPPGSRFSPLGRALRAAAVYLAIVLAVVAGCLWARTRAGPPFGGGWVRYLWLDPAAAPVARYVSCISESGQLIVIWGEAEILSNPYFDDARLDRPLTNREACRVEYGAHAGLKAGAGSDAAGAGIGNRRRSPTLLGRLGFQWAADGHGGRNHMVEWRRSSACVSLPHWALMAPAAVAVAGLAVKRLRRSSRRAPGTCVGCGYDLRATPERCPECGQATPAAAAA
jgi:hypothetical protein